MNVRQQVGICGAFDLENFGDILFPMIAEAELRERLGSIDLHKYSYHQKSTPEWPFQITSLTELPAIAYQLDGMILGGGDLIRFDQHIVPGYFPPSPALPHPTGFWLTPILIAAQAGCSVIWNAPGVYLEIPRWAEPLVELAIHLSSYVNVRNHTSRLALLPFAGNTEIHVVPDSVFGIEKLVSTEKPSEAYLHLRESIGLRKPYIVVQATSGLNRFIDLTEKHPHIFADYQLLILPIGPILGDHVSIFNDCLPEAVRLTEQPNPLVTAELIGHASAVIGSSLHIGITALAFGVPVFRPGKTFNGKYAILADYNTVYTFDYIAEIDPDWFAAKLGKAAPSALVKETLQQLSKHWDRVANILTNEGKNADNVETLGNFWQSMPGLLKTWSDRYESAVQEYDSLRAEYQAFQAERKAIYNSNSWKITAPLRSISTMLKKFNPNKKG